MKNLLHELMVYHCKGIISLNLSVNSLRFTPNEYYLTQCSMGNSINMFSEFDIDRNSIIDKSKFDLHTSPEIILNKVEEINWHSDIWSLGIILAMVFSDKLFETTNDELESFYANKKIPEIFYSNIKNIYIKAIIIGLLRIDPYERPNIFQIIEIYNKLVIHLEMTDKYKLEYTKSDVLCI
jgi:serine/threonine protein kinase